MSRIEQNLGNRVIGLNISWPLVRCLQFGLMLFLIAMIAMIQAQLIMRLLLAAVVTLGVWVTGHRFAHIAGDETGLYVTRYFRPQFIEWNDVLSVQPSLAEGGIKISFRVAVSGLHDAVALFPNMNVSPAAAALFGRQRLEIVDWIQEHIRGGQNPLFP